MYIVYIVTSHIFTGHLIVVSVGATGRQGIAGRSGQDGRTGATGRNGLNGRTGASGATGLYTCTYSCR